MPRWASNFAPGIKAKFKDLSGEIKKEINSPGPFDFPPESLAKIMFKKCRYFIKRVVTSAKIQNAREASHHLTLTDNCQTFYLHVFAFV